MRMHYLHHHHTIKLDFICITYVHLFEWRKKFKQFEYDEMLTFVCAIHTHIIHMWDVGMRYIQYNVEIEYYLWCINRLLCFCFRNWSLGMCVCVCVFMFVWANEIKHTHTHTSLTSGYCYKYYCKYRAYEILCPLYANIAGSFSIFRFCGKFFTKIDTNIFIFVLLCYFLFTLMCILLRKMLNVCTMEERKRERDKERARDS